MTNEPRAPFRSQTGFVVKTDYFLEIFCAKCKLNGLTDILENALEAPFQSQTISTKFHILKCKTEHRVNSSIKMFSFKRKIRRILIVLRISHLIGQ